MAETVAPASGIKDYIISSRKAGYPDSAIIDSLKKVKWPDDVIQAAVREANGAIAPVPEKPAMPPALPAAGAQAANPAAQQTAPEQPKQQAASSQAANAQAKNTPAQAGASQVPNDLFTKPPAEVFPQANAQASPSVKKGGFSFVSLLAFLLSPIPFIGLGVALNALDGIKKNKQSGMIIAVLAIIINIGSILFVLYVIYQIFSFEPDQMQGLAKYLNDIFHFTT